MTHSYWLTPIDTLEPFVLGADRICCEPAAQLEQFRAALKRIHPRMLMLFKAGLLPGDPNPSVLPSSAGASCGSDRIPFSLSEQGVIRFGDTAELMLSSCAQAMVQRLLDPEEAWTMLHSNKAREPELQGRWLLAMEQWLRQHKHVILIREDVYR